jgi:hypothetical protein
MLEEFDLLKALFRFFFGFVRTTQVLTFFGENFIAAGNFLDHGAPRWIGCSTLREVDDSNGPLRVTGEQGNQCDYHDAVSPSALVLPLVLPLVP